MGVQFFGMVVQTIDKYRKRMTLLSSIYTYQWVIKTHQLY